MGEPIIPSKLADFSFTALVKSTSAVTKGLIGLGLILFIVLGVKSCIKKPLPTTTQTAEKIENKSYYLQPHFGGCARIIVQPDKK